MIDMPSEPHQVMGEMTNFRMIPAARGRVAQSLFIPSVPRVLLPHPVAGGGEANMAEAAKLFMNEVMDRLAA